MSVATLDRASQPKRGRRPQGDVGLHLRCLRHRARLDRLIAGGVDVGLDPELALRARQLVADRRRGRLAGALRRVLTEAQRAGSGRSSAAPLARNPLVVAAPALSELARLLASGEAVSPRGVALVERLLGDYDSPLNRPAPHGELVLAARSARDALVSS